MGDMSCTLKRTDGDLYSLEIKNGKGEIVTSKKDISFTEAVCELEMSMYVTDRE